MRKNEINEKILKNDERDQLCWKIRKMVKNIEYPLIAQFCHIIGKNEDTSNKL